MDKETEEDTNLDSNMLNVHTDNNRYAHDTTVLSNVHNSYRTTVDVDKPEGCCDKINNFIWRNQADML
jgi:hypothetical protein